MINKDKVTVIFGGQSTEHEVSGASARSVINHLNPAKYDVAMIGITKDGRWLPYKGPVELIGTGEWQALAEKKAIGEPQLLKDKNKNESPATSLLSISDEEANQTGRHILFPVLHGLNGEDGTIQGMFELAGLPYVGCGVLSSALCMDKAYTKIIFEKEGIPQGKYIVLTRKNINKELDESVSRVESLLGYPCFVKPSNAGSSVGVGKAHNREELISSLGCAARYDHRILVEEFIDAREIECAVLGNDQPEASVTGEVVPCNEFYDYAAKYNSGDDSTIIIPARLDFEVSEKIREYSLRAFRALDCSGLARADFFVHKTTGEIYINELNTLPGFTSISMYPKLWEATGVTYGELIDRLIELAVLRFEENKRDLDT